jgi:tetratricopeptide (TPR) repeat protein
MPRLALLVGLLGCAAGCQVLSPAARPDSPAMQLWQQGQEAMKAGRIDEAMTRYQMSLAADPTFTRNHLSLAAAFLHRGDDEGAVLHLERYLSTNPQHLAVRGHYAELLRKQGRLGEAQAEYERFDADAQELGADGRGHLIHCHSRLMELAEQREDEYAEHLHRGIGLYHLACERTGTADDERQTAESLLCKAAGELTLARLQRPDEGRASLYLYEVWRRLGQERPARRCLRDADEAAPFSALTPNEQARLQTAGRRHEPLAAPR